MGLNGLISDSRFARKWAIERERSGLSIGACFYSYHSYFSYSLFRCFHCFLTSLVFFLFLLVFSLCYSMLLFIVHIYGFLYCLLWQGLPFLPLNYFGLVVCVLSRLPHWSTGCPTITTIPCWPCHTSFPDKSGFYFCFLSSLGTLIQIRLVFLPYQPL